MVRFKSAFVDVEGPFEEGPGICRIAHLPQHGAQVAQAYSYERMVRTEYLLRNDERSSPSSFAFTVIALENAIKANLVDTRAVTAVDTPAAASAAATACGRTRCV